MWIVVTATRTHQQHQQHRSRDLHQRRIHAQQPRRWRASRSGRRVYQVKSHRQISTCHAHYAVIKTADVSRHAVRLASRILECRCTELELMRGSYTRNSVRRSWASCMPCSAMPMPMPMIAWQATLQVCRRRGRRGNAMACNEELTHRWSCTWRLSAKFPRHHCACCGPCATTAVLFDDAVV